jgi:hypothetical protein
VKSMDWLSAMALTSLDRCAPFIPSPSAFPDLSARRVQFTILAPVLVDVSTLTINMSSPFQQTFSTIKPIASRCDNSLGPKMTRFDALYSQSI